MLRIVYVLEWTEDDESGGGRELTIFDESNPSNDSESGGRMTLEKDLQGQLRSTQRIA
jgi:hypothetical protein